MPQMPRYDSNRQLTTQQPSVLATENTDSKIMDVATDAVAKTAETAFKWSEALDTIQKTTAKANYESGALDILNRAENDPNYNNSDLYHKELKDLKSKSVTGISKPGVKSAMTFELDHQTTLNTMKINNVYRKKLIGVGQVNTFRLLENETKNPSPDSPLKIKEVLDAQVKAGVFSAEEAYKLEKQAVKDSNWSRFTLTAKVNRDEAKKLAESGELNFDSDQADKAMNYLNNLKNIEDKNTLIDKIDNRYNIVDAIANGKEDIYNLSPMAQAMVNNDEVLSAAIVKGQQKGKGYTPETIDAENYVKIFEDASKATDSDSLSKLAVDAVYRDKTITPDKLGLVLFYAQQRAKNLMLSEKILEPIGTETTPEQLQAMQVDAGLNSISRWAKGGAVSVKDHSSAITDYLTAVKGGTKPLDAMNTTIKSANLRLHPAMATYPKEGQLLVDQYGRQAMAFPDGTIKSMEVPKAKTAQKPESKSKESVDFKTL